MSARDECPALGASHDVPAGYMSGQKVRAGMSGREVPARSMSSAEVRRCSMTATAVSAVIAGGSVGGQRQAAKRENWRENCGQRKG